MDDNLYKIIEVVGSSAEGIEEAINVAITRASKSLHNLRWFEVLETRGHIENGRVAHYQVRIKVGFRIGDTDYSEDAVPEPGTDPLHEGP